MGMGKPIPPPLPDTDGYTVEFDAKSDTLYPHNWKSSTKYIRFYWTNIRDANIIF